MKRLRRDVDGTITVAHSSAVYKRYLVTSEMTGQFTTLKNLSTAVIQHITEISFHFRNRFTTTFTAQVESTRNVGQACRLGTAQARIGPTNANCLEYSPGFTMINSFHLPIPRLLATRDRRYSHLN